VALGEFDLIEKFFSTLPQNRKDVILGIGDDAALIKVPPKKLLAASTDTLVENVHFYPDTPAHAIGYKSLAVNLSDFAAMGAMPCWVSLALILPKIDERWIKSFTKGFSSLLKAFNLQLIGGNVTQGNLAITAHMLGTVEKLKTLRRNTAKPGDLIYVTGTLGDAGLAVQQLRKNHTSAPELIKRLYYPTPRVTVGIALGGIANAAIDISDGLMADLNHILNRSEVGAVLFPQNLPLSETIQRQVSHEKAIEFALSSGDDYELCFTVSPKKEKAMQKALEKLKCRYTYIGNITAKKKFYLKTSRGQKLANIKGYQHFK
jgi:thiamine-monophosphate kinase